jgi:hypothetical protein
LKLLRNLLKKKAEIPTHQYRRSSDVPEKAGGREFEEIGVSQQKR